MRFLLFIAVTAFWHCPQCSAMENDKNQKNLVHFFHAAGGPTGVATKTCNQIDFFVAISTFAATVDPLEEDALGVNKRLVDFYLAPWVAHPLTKAMFADMRFACGQVIDLFAKRNFKLSHPHLQIFANFLTQLEAMLRLPAWSARRVLARSRPYYLKAYLKLKLGSLNTRMPDLVGWEKKAKSEIRQMETGETFYLNKTGHRRPCGTTLNKPYALTAFRTLLTSLQEQHRYDVVQKDKQGADVICTHTGYATQQEVFLSTSSQLLVKIRMPLEDMKKYMDRLKPESETASKLLNNGMMTNPLFMRRRHSQVQSQLDEVLLLLKHKIRKFDEMVSQIYSSMVETKRMAEEIGCQFSFSEQCPNGLIKTVHRMPSDMEFPCAGTLSPYLCCGAKSIRKQTKLINSEKTDDDGDVYTVEGCSELGLSKLLVHEL